MLLGLSSFGPLTMSIYTPIMPLIGTDLATGADAVKFTLTTYMLGFAVGQLFYGPLSDRFGRRPVVLVGVAFFTLTSIGCAFAPSIAGLICLRILQGLGAASGAVLGRGADARCVRLQGNADRHELDRARHERVAGPGAVARRLPRRALWLARDVLVRRRLRPDAARLPGAVPRRDQPLPQRQDRPRQPDARLRARCCATSASSATC
jgi:hypothetical protein